MKCVERTLDNYDLGFVETHVDETGVDGWRAKARKLLWRSIAYPAHPSGHATAVAGAADANEGGERLLVRGHREARSLIMGGSTDAIVQVDGCNA